MNFHGQDIAYDMFWKVTATSKANSMFKQVKNYHLQLYKEEYKYIDVESQKCYMLRDSDNEEFFKAQM